MSETEPNSSALIPPRMTILSDHPILREGEEGSSREPDSFKLDSRLGAVYDIIRHKNTRPPLAIAVYGDWGTGKSSAMRWLSDQLAEWSELSKTKREGHCRTRTVWFDPWKYTKREDVWRGLIAEVILNAIDVHGASLHTVVSAARKFGLFLGRSFLNVLSSAVLTVGAKEAGVEAKVDLDALSKIAEDYRQTSHPEKAFLNEFETALRDWVKASLARDERMVIFIDDLDRCLPDVVLEVLEALKLYLNIPQLIFVVGLDREVVDSVVRYHYIEHGLGESKAQHYLDKMFQVEVDIPPSQTQMEGYIKRQIEAMNTAADGYWSDNLTGWNKDYKEIIEDKIAALAEGNPREVKRLLNSTLLRATAAALQVDPDSSEPQRFTQGCQVYLMQRILRKYVPKSASLLRENETLEFFERWSQFIAAHPGFRRRADRTEDQPAGKPSGKPGRPSQDAEADEAYKALREPAPRYRDEKRETIPLLAQPDLWDLLVIPFSPQVAAAAVIDSDPSRDRKRPVSRSEEKKGPSPAHGGKPEGPPAVAAGAEVGRQEAGFRVDMMPTLLSAIARSLDKPVDSLQPEDWRQVRELDLSRTEFRNLKPLSALTGLQSLNLQETWIGDEDLTHSHLSALTGLQSLSLRKTSITDAGLASLAPLTRLQYLNLQSTRITGAGLANLTALAGLQTLVLASTQIADAELAHLAGLSGLQVLNLGWCDKITDAGLVYLSTLTGLLTLDLTDTKITEVGLASLSASTSLQWLVLRRCTQITDTGLAYLPGLTGLRHLSLTEMQITDAGLKHLSALARLRTLDLSATQITDAGLEHLSALTGLQALYLSGKRITDAGLAHLSAMTSLQTLDLFDTQITDAGLAHLSRCTKLEYLETRGTKVTQAGKKRFFESLEWDEPQ